jgi:ATP-dependent DNA ligase
MMPPVSRTWPIRQAIPTPPSSGTTPTRACLRAKWDGFRCIVFRDGDEVEARAATQTAHRSLPEVVEAVKESLPERCVVDGEIFVAVGERLEFERLQERITPADSRVRMLAEPPRRRTSPSTCSRSTTSR